MKVYNLTLHRITDEVKCVLEKHGYTLIDRNSHGRKVPIQAKARQLHDLAFELLSSAAEAQAQAILVGGSTGLHYWIIREAHSRGLLPIEIAGKRSHKGTRFLPKRVRVIVNLT